MITWRKSVIPLAIVVVCAGVAVCIALLEPGAAKVTSDVPAPLVEVVTVEPYTQRARIVGSGIVRAARSLQLTSEVSGRVVHVADSLEPGIRVDEGDLLVRIDPRDYRAELQRRRGELAQARLELAQSQAQQDVAVAEQRRADFDVGPVTPLALREPQVRARKAKVESARAAVAQARVNLERTRLSAPWDAAVVATEVDEGQHVRPGNQLAELVGTERFWIEASVPVPSLRWLPDDDALAAGEQPVARIEQHTEQGSTLEREGRLVQRVANLDEDTLRAQLLIEVRDPLEDNPPLLPGARVEVAVEGQRVRHAVALPARALREGRYVWRLDDAGRLSRVPVEVAFQAFNDDRTLVLEPGALEAGDQVVVSPLQSPLEGMRVRVRDASRREQG